MREDGVTAAMTVEGATDKHVFQVFIEKVLLPTLRPGDLVVMDRLGAHRPPIIAELLSTVGAAPPYSPDFNPIELCFSKFKTWLRTQEARTKEALDLAIIQGLDSITSQDATNWIKHCGYGSLSVSPNG